ncbi:MAG: glycosyltransferase, partial [Flavobacteriaceae bacterium]
KPIIMTDAGGCTELIDETSGIITPIKNPIAIGRAISSLVNNDDLRIQMGINAKLRIKNRYHIDDTVEDTYELYHQLLTS